MKATNQPVSFERPPVVEVVCSLTFNLSSPLKAAHVGMFWDVIKSDFPNTEDAPPLADVQERPLTDENNVNLQLLQLPPLRRSWFLSEDGRRVVQLQDDRFIYNWKRVDEEDAYPSYAQMIAGFKTQWQRFLSFLKDQALDELTIAQLELTYVNHIPVASIGEQLAFSLFKDHQHDVSAERFLPKPLAFKWATAYDLPKGEGRLHVVSQLVKVTETGEPLIRMDMTARGVPSDTSKSGCDSWFDTAHEWITHGFADLTVPAVQKEIWQRTQ